MEVARDLNFHVGWAVSNVNRLVAQLDNGGAIFLLWKAFFILKLRAGEYPSQHARLVRSFQSPQRLEPILEMPSGC